MTFSIDANLPDVVHRLDALKRRQVPFAEAVALTMTAQDAQAEIRKRLPDRFTIRRPWIEKGVRIQRATKARPRALVYSRDEFMYRQEHGGEKRPTLRYTPIPRKARRSPTALIPRSRWPRRLEGKPRHFTRPVGDGRSLGVFQVVGRKGVPRLLWILDPRTLHVRPRWGFAETVDQVVRKRFARNFGRALARAIATSR